MPSEKSNTYKMAAVVQVKVIATQTITSLRHKECLEKVFSYLDVAGLLTAAEVSARCPLLFVKSFKYSQGYEIRPLFTVPLYMRRYAISGRWLPGDRHSGEP